MIIRFFSSIGCIKKRLGKSKTNDGAMRLRSLINWMNECPENPYNFVLFLPIGEDLLSRYAPITEP